jgi:pantetheine-phosphate adenylyltransferase
MSDDKLYRKTTLKGKIYKKVAVGGTFDKFHQGHQRLLRKAFEISDEVLIGVTSDEFARTKGKIEPCNTRMSNLKRTLEKFGDKYYISRLDDQCGPAIIEDDIEALVVSEETEPTAHKINQIREKRGLKPLDIITIHMVLAEDGKPISSTRIRKGEIDFTGAILRD